MFNLGWSEILMIAVVAIIVVGPKDLPRMLRTLGKTMGQLRRTANDFKRQFDDALKEAEQQADFAETRKSLEGLGKIDPLADVKKELDSVSKVGDDIKGAVEKSAGKTEAGKTGAGTEASATKTKRPAAKPKSAKSKPKPAGPAAKAQAPTSGSDAA
jgi:sec-independent protein translocase protein TatB